MTKIEIRDRTVSRFKKFVKKSGQCLVWTGYRDKDGYGRFRMGDKKIQASRASFILFKGPIPRGKIVCHKCDNPPCVNSKHLFLGTFSDNSLDSFKKKRPVKNHVYQQSIKTHCLNGHPFNEENTYTWRNHRRCKACHRNRAKESYGRRSS